MEWKMTLEEEQAESRNVYRLQVGGQRLCEALRKIVELDTHQDEEDSEPYLGRLGQIALKALNSKVNDKELFKNGT